MPSARHRARSLRASFVVTFAAALGGCGGTVGGEPNAPDAGTDAKPEPPGDGSTEVQPAGCPGAAPTYGEACPSSAVSLSCAYDAFCCGNRIGDQIWTCDGAVWQLTQSPGTCNPPPPMCPELPPADGSPCASECGLTPSCGWGDCYGSPTTVGSCSGGVWHVSSVSCNPPPPVDAGAADGGGAGDLCGQSANGAPCASGLVCCYPCGVQGCSFTCTPPCDPKEPACVGGCLAVP